MTTKNNPLTHDEITKVMLMIADGYADAGIAKKLKRDPNCINYICKFMSRKEIVSSLANNTPVEQLVSEYLARREAAKPKREVRVKTAVEKQQVTKITLAQQITALEANVAKVNERLTQVLGLLTAPQQEAPVKPKISIFRP